MVLKFKVNNDTISFEEKLIFFSFKLKDLDLKKKKNCMMSVLIFTVRKNVLLHNVNYSIPLELLYFNVSYLFSTCYFSHSKMNKFQIWIVCLFKIVHLLEYVFSWNPGVMGMTSKGWIMFFLLTWGCYQTGREISSCDSDVHFNFV